MYSINRNPINPCFGTPAIPVYSKCVVEVSNEGIFKFHGISYQLTNCNTKETFSATGESSETDSNKFIDFLAAAKGGLGARPIEYDTYQDLREINAKLRERWSNNEISLKFNGVEKTYNPTRDTWSS